MHSLCQEVGVHSSRCSPRAWDSTTIASAITRTSRDQQAQSDKCHENDRLNHLRREFLESHIKIDLRYAVHDTHSMVLMSTNRYIRDPSQAG